jgi:integrase
MGTGSVYRRKDGRWVAAVTVGGKRKVAYARTKRQAREKLALLVREAARGSIPQPGKRTLDDLVEQFLEVSAHSLKPRTLDDYKKTYERHVKPMLGSVRLSKLEPSHVQLLYTALQGQCKHRTAQKCHAVLHRALKFGVLWGWLSENPCDRVLRPRYRPDRKELWTPEELAIFLEGARGHWLYPLYLLLVATGARVGELLALTWRDVDFRAGTINITKSGQHIGGKWVVGTPKTEAGARTLTLPTVAVAALRRQRAQQLEWRLRAGSGWSDYGLVFTQRFGAPLRCSDVAHAFRKLCVRIGVRTIRVHDLRHLHASLLLNQGISLADVSKRLGHANVHVTASIYAHAIDKRDERAARAIERVLALARGGG